MHYDCIWVRQVLSIGQMIYQSKCGFILLLSLISYNNSIFNFRDSFGKISIINKKYSSFEQIKFAMSSAIYNRRPNCSDILNASNDWILDENEIKCLNILDKMPEEFSSAENEFFKIFFTDKTEFYDNQINNSKYVNEFEVLSELSNHKYRTENYILRQTEDYGNILTLLWILFILYEAYAQKWIQKLIQIINLGKFGESFKVKNKLNNQLYAMRKIEVQGIYWYYLNILYQ